MGEKLLLKLALVVAIVGILSLFLVANIVELDEKMINKLDNIDIGNDVKIKGTINKVFESDKVKIIEIEQPSTISVIIFKNKNFKNFSLAKGQNIEVIGQVEEYNGELEIIAERIRVIG